jgi:hypothetical protein
MGEHSWAKVLNVIYSNDRIQKEGSLDLIQDSLDKSRKETLEALSFLERHELIEEEGDDYLLTEKGFDVARERDMQLSQLETNMHLAVFTFLLTVGIIVQAVYQIGRAGLFGQITSVSLVSFSLIMFMLLERRTGLFRMVLDGR